MDDPTAERVQEDLFYGDTDPVQPLTQPRDFKPVWDGKVTKRQFADWLTHTRTLRRSCATLPLTFITWLTFLFVVWFHGNVDSIFRMRRCLEQAIEEVQAPREIEGGLNAAVSEDVSQSQSLRFGELTSTNEMWSWIIGGLIPAFSGSPARPGFVRTFNQVVGDIELRETRMTAGTCKASPELAAYYRQTCFSGSSISSSTFGSASKGSSSMSSTDFSNKSTGTDMDVDMAFVAGAGLSEAASVNKERFLAWLSVRYPTEGVARAEELRRAGWVDDATEKVEALIALFNAELKVYAHISVSFFFKDGGLVNQDLQVRPLSTDIYPEWYHIVPDVLWILLLIKFIANSAQRVVDSKKRRFCSRCCESPWLALDWISIFLGLVLAGFFVFFTQFLSLLSDDMVKLGTAPEPIGNETVSTAWERADFSRRNLQYHEITAKIIEEMHMLIIAKVFYRLGMYWYAMTLLVRFFQGFRGQPRIMQITSTVASAFADLYHFGLILVVVFVNFALAGYVLFGPEVAEWSRVQKALQSTLSVAFGRLNYHAIHEIAPYTAVVWLFSFIVSIVFILMNLLLAIIMDHYTGVWHDVGDRGHDIVEQLRDMIGDACWTGAYLFRFVYRLVRSRSPAFCKKVLPKVKSEQERMPIPYEWILGQCEADPHGWATEEMLNMCDCDENTAARLLTKAEAHVRRHVDEIYPLDKLFGEFDDSMMTYYSQLDEFCDEMRGWFSDRMVDTGNLQPRQKKLEGLAQHILLANDPSLEPPHLNPQPEEIAKALTAGSGMPEALTAGSGMPDVAEGRLQLADNIPRQHEDLTGPQR